MRCPGRHRAVPITGSGGPCAGPQAIKGHVLCGHTLSPAATMPGPRHRLNYKIKHHTVHQRYQSTTVLQSPALPSRPPAPRAGHHQGPQSAWSIVGLEPLTNQQ
eukprot:scaffold19716_cov141-Isochrysis_galbana.AAC.2